MTTNQPLFSVLVANFDNGRFLDAALNSLVAQTHSNWEAVVVDDASRDGSERVLESWKTDDRFRIILKPSNEGPGATFATAASAAKGEILGMLGADDALTPNAIERMVAAHAQHPEASLINSDLVLCDENLRPLGQKSPYHRASPGTNLIRDCPISSFATFKRTAYERTLGFDRSLRRAVDHDIYLKLEEVGWLEYVPEPLYLYRAHAGGISQGENGMLAAQSALVARANAYRRRLGTNVPNLNEREYRSLMSVYHRRAARMDVTDRSAVLRHLARSAMYKPQVAARLAFWSAAVRATLGKHSG